jgi:hypothetical protein
MSALTKWLREHRENFLRKMEFLEARWDPTYGPIEPGPVSIEVVDFDALMREIEAFEKSFKKEGK